MTTNDPELPYQSIPPEDPPELAEAPPQDRHDPYAALRVRDYRRYFIGNGLSVVGQQMAGVTVAWELYARTNSAAALGMVGLVQIIPILILALPAGHLIDRFSRKKLLLITTAVSMVSYLLMGCSSRFAVDVHAGSLLAHVLQFMNGIVTVFARALGDSRSQFNDPHIPVMFALLFLNGSCRSITQPAKQSLIPMLVPANILSNAITWSASLFETSSMIGPTLAGFIIAGILVHTGGHSAHTWAYTAIYWLNVVCQLVQFINFSLIRVPHAPASRAPLTLQSLFAGVRFVFGNSVILSVMTLDLFAVLLGGATALLPVYAKDILHVGPIGLGWLRAAPSIGAISMALFLAHAPPMQRAGRNLLIAVTGFGVATIVFGFSRNFWLSMAALIVTGLCDNISVVVRHTLVQLFTPNEMRGRVSAVNSVFISSSNELGEFESGATASVGIRFFGPVAGPMLAVAAGGLGTLCVVGAVIFCWPKLRSIGPLRKDV